MELGKQEDTVDVAIYAIADGYINQSIFTREGDRWFAAFHGQGVKTRAASTAHDYSQDILFWGHDDKEG